MNTALNFTATTAKKLCSPVYSFLTKLFTRHEDCLGLSLPAIGKYKIEFWYAPAGYKIIPHTHPSQDIKLVCLFAHNTVFYKKRPGQLLPDNFYAKWYHFGKWFNVRAGDIHYFSVCSYPLIFMNFEKWKTKPTSAATDFNVI